MAEFNHTPGPWEVRGNTVFVEGHETNKIATVCRQHIKLDWVKKEQEPDPQMHSNVLLIASAPELLDALQEIQTAARTLNSSYIENLATKAIEKATTL